MNEQDVRALVREAIERHLGRPHEAARGKGQGANLTGTLDVYPSPLTPHPFQPHSSHIVLKVLPGSEVDDGMCVIEPAVRCNHCGFCQSYGH
jgi:hypothetical protein